MSSSISVDGAALISSSEGWVCVPPVAAAGGSDIDTAGLVSVDSAWFDPATGRWVPAPARSSVSGASANDGVVSVDGDPMRVGSH